MVPLLTIQRQRCIKFRVLRAQDFYTPLALNCVKRQHLPAPEVYKNQSPIILGRKILDINKHRSDPKLTRSSQL